MAQRPQPIVSEPVPPSPATNGADLVGGHSRAEAVQSVTAYSEHIAANVEFLGARAREIAADEVDRAKGLDSKATAMIAGSGALIAASAGFAVRVFEIDAGAGAKRLWAVELGVALLFLLAAGAVALFALVPKAVRTAVHIDELNTWPTPNVLEQDPVLTEGSLMRASIDSIGHARTVNNQKAHRLVQASWAFAGALTSIVALALSIVLHG